LEINLKEWTLRRDDEKNLCKVVTVDYIVLAPAIAADKQGTNRFFVLFVEQILIGFGWRNIRGKAA